MRSSVMKKAALVGLALASFGISTGPAASAGEKPVVTEDTDFVKLGPPKPGEWRDVFEESVQTFEMYREWMPKPHYICRWRISVVPFEGETDVLDEKSLQLLREFLGAYFMTPVALEPVRELPETVRRRASRGFGTQILADDVLRFMARDGVRGLPPGEPWLVYDRGKITLVQPARDLSIAVQQKAMAEMEQPELEDRGRKVQPRLVEQEKRHEQIVTCTLEELPFTIPIGVASLGIVRTDLYGSLPDGSYLNFVFGMGAYANRVAVISPARYSIHYEGQPPGITLRKRFFKVAAHEIGHAFGLAHCQKYGCCMNGSNSLPEADRRPIHLCPECLEKLAWRLDFFDSGLRYRALSKVYLKLGWREEADFAARRAMLDPGILAPAEKDAGVAASKGTEQQ